jgi:prepilin-type N-terminal cleavage/methylation domain-containing protein
MKKQQAGFTLIELAIVLVIIGLLLGGVLKGQELINSAKVKNMATDFKNIQVYIYGYQDKFRALPGDDNKANSHVAGGTLATTGGTVGNAVIEGNWDTTTVTDESALFWQHVRLAGLAAGPTNTGDASYFPTNADGGRIGIQSVAGFAKITGMSGAYVVCSNAILGKFAKQLDVSMDDGETSTGSMRAIPQASTGAAVTTASITAGSTATVGDAAPYTVCMTF